MNVVMVPGFMGHPDEVIFQDLTRELETKGHSVTKIAWPHFPDDMQKYTFSETIAHARTVLTQLATDELVLLGFSMGGIIATLLAAEFVPQKLGLISSPYQAGSEDDLAGKYKEWRATGQRDVVSSKYGELRVPFSFIEDARQYNALECIKRVRCPVLCVAGEADTTVPMATTRKIYECANEPKEWRQISGMEHKYKHQPHILAEVNRILLGFVG